MNKSMDTETNVRRTLLVDATPEMVWKALIEPKLANLYMHALPCGEWRPGQLVQWFRREESGDRVLVAKGTVLTVQPGERLRYSAYSPGSQLPDEPASHTTVDLHLVQETEGRTRVELYQGDFAGLPNAERRAREAGRQWVEQLVGLKRIAEEQQQQALAA